MYVRSGPPYARARSLSDVPAPQGRLTAAVARRSGSGDGPAKRPKKAQVVSGKP
ncbi:hypothetical protein [Streptomyces sp. F-1]|uniref:hypothetical protein n=1 Tax=Streptomyces sp. F-1 TaxID=463642 RepID=UPI0015A6E7B0|nr:hypothetical protein [Streptomyces sp. F-1]